MLLSISKKTQIESEELARRLITYGGTPGNLAREGAIVGGILSVASLTLNKDGELIPNDYLWGTDDVFEKHKDLQGKYDEDGGGNTLIEILAYCGASVYAREAPWAEKSKSKAKEWAKGYEDDCDDADIFDFDAMGFSFEDNTGEAIGMEYSTGISPFRRLTEQEYLTQKKSWLHKLGLTKKSWIDTHEDQLSKHGEIAHSVYLLDAESARYNEVIPGFILKYGFYGLEPNTDMKALHKKLKTYVENLMKRGSMTVRCAAVKFIEREVIAFNLVKIVNKNSDNRHNLTGTSEVITVEALILDDNPLGTTSASGLKILTGNSALGFGCGQVRLYDGDKILAYEMGVAKVLSVEQDKVMYDTGHCLLPEWWVPGGTGNNRLFELSLPRGRDYSTSFKAKYM